MLTPGAGLAWWQRLVRLMRAQRRVRVTEWEDAWCLPLAPTSKQPLAGLQLTGGLLSSVGKAIPSSGQEGGSQISLRTRSLTSSDRKDAALLEGRSLYLGLCHDHYGHFCIETLSRLWPFEAEALRRFDHLLVPPLNGRLAPFVIDFFAGLGLADRLQPLHHCTRLQHVTVPDLPIDYPHRVAPVFQRLPQIWPASSNSASDRDRLLVLSREALLPGHTRVVVGAQRMEQALAQAGAFIFHPEQHSLDEQVEVLRTHRRIVAFAGSALHTLMLVGGPRQVRSYSARARPAVFPLLDKALGVQSQHISANAHGLVGLQTQATAFRPEVIDCRPIQSALQTLGWLPTGPMWPAPGPEDVLAHNTAAWLRLLLEQGTNCRTPPPAQLDPSMLQRAWMGSAELRKALRLWQTHWPAGLEWPDLDSRPQ